MPPLGTATTPDPGGSRIIAAGGRKKKRNSVQEGNMATPEDFKKDQSNMKRCDRIGSGQGQKLGKACRHNAERSDRRESGSKRKSNDQSMSGEADSEDSNEEKLTLGRIQQRSNT
ncbi:uncharacterized protein LOC130267201 isoform X2 [Hyla sarda]|uniref:uncharacterized protein LOC130267201 isoform X2 n=1 Tax=Hyla sarda TaxID=327740 RepID=UPI0024C3F155|nr:uncharacterized protein LOC130267201 isoform X2 [Hyla sarda]